MWRQKHSRANSSAFCMPSSVPTMAFAPQFQNIFHLPTCFLLQAFLSRCWPLPIWANSFQKFLRVGRRFMRAFGSSDFFLSCNLFVIFLPFSRRFVRFWRQLRGRPKFSFVSLLSPSDRSQPKDGTLDANNNNNNLPPPQKKLTPTIILSAEDQLQQLDLLSVTERGELLSLSSAGDRQKMNGNVRENEVAIL
jgi:hypothetical protein